MDRGALIECLQSAAAGSLRSANRSRTAFRTALYARRSAVPPRARCDSSSTRRIFFAAGNLAYAGVASIVGQQNEIAREEWRMRSAQIQQHAVVAGDGDHAHRRDDGCLRCTALVSAKFTDLLLDRGRVSLRHLRGKAEVSSRLISPTITR